MPLRIGTRFPSLDGATGWINGEARSEQFVGAPVLVQFWALSCPICKANIPRVRQWIDDHANTGIQLVSIHMPRTPLDMCVHSVIQTASELGMTEPCAIDNQHVIGDRFQTIRMWPYYFVFDSAGRLRSHAAGQRGIVMAGAAIKRIANMECSTADAI